MNRMVRPVMFAFEPDVVKTYALIKFGAAGAPTLNTSYSKGICNVARNSVAFTADTQTSTALANVSSFAGLYKGMTITGTDIPASTTISSMNAGAGTITLSQAATGTHTGVALAAAGGQYTVTFGAQYSPAKFDAYVRLLAAGLLWDETLIPGSASALDGSPYALNMFLVSNNISNGSLANLVIQFGSLVGASFLAADPNTNEQARLWFDFTRSTAL